MMQENEKSFPIAYFSAFPVFSPKQERITERNLNSKHAKLKNERISGDFCQSSNLFFFHL